MKAVAFTYKSTKANTIETKIPEPGEHEVLIKVKYSALDSALEPVIHKTSDGSFLHKYTEPHLFCGWHYSGSIEKLGPNLKNSWKVGDSVYGHLQYVSDQTQGSLAEFITVKEDACGIKPVHINDDLAAASTTEFLTALQGLRDHGGLTQRDGSSGSGDEETSQQSVLINGAGGGVGIAAVQIAKRMGAKVTAICSTKDVKRMNEMGVNAVIDRKKTPNVLEELEPGQFDIIFDTPSVLPVAKTLKYLKPRKGNYVLTAPHLGMAWGFLVSFFVGKGVKMFIVKSKKADLELLGPWLEDGMEVDIDSTFSVKDIEQATARNRDPSKKGRVVVQVEDGW